MGIVDALKKLVHRGSAQSQPASPEGVNPLLPPTQPLTTEGMSWQNTSMEGQPLNPQAIEAGTGRVIPNPEVAPTPAVPEGTSQTPPEARA